MPRPTFPLRPLSLVAIALLGACSGGNGGPIIDSGPVFDAPYSMACIEAMEHSDFDWINDNIFNRSCANFSSCHQGNTPAGSLNMLPTRAYDELVNVPSEYFGDWMRVKPCSPEESYLLVRMRCFSETVPEGMSCEHGPLDGGSLMPPGVGQRPICGPKVEAIRRWILNGAPEVGTENSCGTGPDSGIPDGGPCCAPDGGIPDGGIPDGGIPDGGTPDAP